MVYIKSNTTEFVTSITMKGGNVCVIWISLLLAPLTLINLLKTAQSLSLPIDANITVGKIAKLVQIQPVKPEKFMGDAFSMLLRPIFDFQAQSANQSDTDTLEQGIQNIGKALTSVDHFISIFLPSSRKSKKTDYSNVNAGDYDP